MKKKYAKYSHFICLILFLFLLCSFSSNPKIPGGINNEVVHPRIVNIINFIRFCEPRYKEITEDVLYQTVVKQIEVMEKNNLGGTFLLQYDALIDPRYQKLLKNLPENFEIGAWWELPQPLVEKAGIKWRGRYPWDWAANVGFSIGYSPAEREKIVDVYMNEFKRVFNRYPKSVGSWFIDAHTLLYMYKKYNLAASCCCRDQIGTDGYTLWGGYWNQAYYPSEKNSYMPAQNEKNQIPVPVFRMLGSDPIRQYDDGLGKEKQGVATLEPAFSKNGGGDSTWVNWYFKEFMNGACMKYAYVQAGQENSFTWKRISAGFELQMKLFAKLRDENKIKVETLSQTSRWFRQNFKTTPATSVTALNGLKGDNSKTVWFNSRFYRANILWENGTLRFRDIHLFDEKLPSDYLTAKCTTANCAFYTLPVIDGHQWSNENIISGLRLKVDINGKEMMIEGGQPVVNDSEKGKLHIVWPLKNLTGNFLIDFDERGIKMKIESKTSIAWFLELITAGSVELPYTKISEKKINCKFKGLDYHVNMNKGSISVPGKKIVFRLIPAEGIISMDFSKR
jgi:hypothetical protein